MERIWTARWAITLRDGQIVEKVRNPYPNGMMPFYILGENEAENLKAGKVLRETERWRGWWKPPDGFLEALEE